MKKLAIVILNWNGKKWLKKFIPTLTKFSDTHEIIVADNQSTDDSVSFLKQRFPEVKLLINSENGGFAKGYNEALEQLKGQYEYYALVNSDIEVTENWLNPLLEKLDTSSSIAAVQPKIKAYYKKTHFEHAGAAGGFIDRNYYPFCRGRIFNAVEEDSGQYDNEKEVFWTSGACMILRSSVYHQLNGFDNDFFAHMEEIDLCWRMKLKGYKLFCIPSSTVYHVGGGTLAYENPKKTYLNFRNNLFMIHKNYQGILVAKIFYRLLLDGIAGLSFIAKFQFNHLAAILKAHMHYYRVLPDLRKKRKIIQSAKNTPNLSGIYRTSIIYSFYFKRKQLFDNLNKRFFNTKEAYKTIN